MGTKLGAVLSIIVTMTFEEILNFCEFFGITSVEILKVSAYADVAPVRAGETDPGSNYWVRLDDSGIGDKKIHAIRLIRVFLPGIRLREAKDMVDAVKAGEREYISIVENYPYGVAHAIADYARLLGVRVSVGTSIGNHI